jgi:hypothetical protein
MANNDRRQNPEASIDARCATINRGLGALEPNHQSSLALQGRVHGQGQRLMRFEADELFGSRMDRYFVIHSPLLRSQLGLHSSYAGATQRPFPDPPDHQT